MHSFMCFLHGIGAQQALQILSPAIACVQEAEVAKMLKARMNSGKSASTSAPQSDSVITDAIFADLDTEGQHCHLSYHSTLCHTGKLNLKNISMTACWEQHCCLFAISTHMLRLC